MQNVKCQEKVEIKLKLDESTYIRINHEIRNDWPKWKVDFYNENYVVNKYVAKIEVESK